MKYSIIILCKRLLKFLRAKGGKFVSIIICPLCTNPQNEKDLVILLSRDDEDAFEALYYSYSTWLLAYLIKLVKSESLAADLLQEAFLTVWNKRQNIDPDQCFRAYLFRIAGNLAYDFFRNAARKKKLLASLIQNHYNQSSYIEEVFSGKENNQFLMDAISSLPIRRREVFQLVRIEERPYQEVSQLLNISVSTINDHVVKATKSLRVKLKSYYLSAISTLVVFLLS